MNKTFLFVTYLIFNSFFSNAQDWKLVWSDEFNYTGKPDSTKWNYELGYKRNKELQYYTARTENARVENTHLVIEAINEKHQGYQYTSASLITKNRETWKYGRFEIRAKLPGGRGTWPAIWMLGTNIDEAGWPECGEIDIMENVGYEPDVVHANIHTEAYNHVKGTNKGNKITLDGPNEKFHVYAVEWFPDRMEFFVDEIKYFTFENQKKSWKEWPFDQPFYLIINLAIGGGWGGQQGIDETVFPVKYTIDYVRVFKTKEQ